jgi:hypothetical protein
MATASPHHTPDPDPNSLDLIREIVADPQVWMDTPNDQLGGQRPRDLVSTDREERVWDLAQAVKFGLPS